MKTLKLISLILTVLTVLASCAVKEPENTSRTDDLSLQTNTGLPGESGTNASVSTKEPTETKAPEGIITANGYVFAEVEDYSTVRIYDKNGKLTITATAEGPCFISCLPKGGRLYMTAQAPGGLESEKVEFRSDKDVGNTEGDNWAGLNSHLFYSDTYLYYVGKTVVNESKLEEARNILEHRIKQVRELTGKNTKIIILMVTNPATIYHDKQLEPEEGPGDIVADTPATAFVEYMSGHEDIYVVDCRKALMQHNNELIFHQTDTHYTELGTYYCYAAMMDYIKKDFPKAIVHPLTDYSIDYEVGDTGDLISIMNLPGFYEYTPYLNPKFAEDLRGDVLIPKREGSGVGINVYTLPDYSEINAPDNPTAYLVGDSYSANFSLFASQAFSKLYMNPGIMLDQMYHGIAEKKPDYLVMIYTERNINSNLSKVRNFAFD